MEKIQKKDILWLLLLTVFYGFCGMAGGAFYGFYILSGILSIPLGLYVFKRGWNYYVVISALLLTGIVGSVFEPMAALVFTIMIIIPGFVFGVYGKKQGRLLTTVLINGLTYFIGIIIIFGMLMWVYHVNVSEVYNRYVEETSKQALKILEQQQNMVLSQFNDSVEEKAMKESYGIIRMAMKEGFYYMQYLFPGLLFLLCFGLGFFQSLVSHLIITGLGWRESQLKELVNFGITPIIPIALIVTWFWRQSLDGQIESLFAMASGNVLFVFSILLFFLGILSVVYMIRTMKTGIGLKIFFGALGVIWLFTSPVLFVILGFFDGIFNFRKVERII